MVKGFAVIAVSVMTREAVGAVFFGVVDHGFQVGFGMAGQAGLFCESQIGVLDVAVLAFKRRLRIGLQMLLNRVADQLVGEVVHFAESDLAIWPDVFCVAVQAVDIFVVRNEQCPVEVAGLAKGVFDLGMAVDALDVHAFLNEGNGVAGGAAPG